MKKILNIISSNEDKSLFGLKTILDIEKISFNKCLREDIDGNLKYDSLVDVFLNNDEVDPWGSKPKVFIGNSSHSSLLSFFGIKKVLIERKKIVDIKLTGNLFKEKINDKLNKYLPNKIVRFPISCIHIIDKYNNDNKNFEVLAYFADNSLPAIIKKGNIVWCLFDICEAFYLLTTENYITKENFKKRDFSSFPLLQKLYYYAPSFLRKIVQEFSFKKLLERVSRERIENFRTNFPIDCTGWIIVEIIKALVLHTGIPLVTINKFPGKYKSCIIFTHDIEPTVYSYKKGIMSLFNEISKSKVKSSMGLVSVWAKKYPEFIINSKDDMEFYCQGLYHEGKTLELSYEQLYDRVKLAKEILEELLKQNISGYRSPRMNRSQDLFKAIEKAGYKYSSVLVDSDRENTHFFGGGISINFPFRPLLTEGKIREAKFLEFPVTAPDCITPIFMGFSEEKLQELYQQKIDFVCDIGGCFVSLIHAGVFNKKDSRIRNGLLLFVIGVVENNKNIWKVGFRQAYEWWISREKLNISITNDKICVENKNNKEILDIALKIETLSSTKEVKIDSINALNHSVIKCDEDIICQT